MLHWIGIGVAGLWIGCSVACIVVAVQQARVNRKWRLEREQQNRLLALREDPPKDWLLELYDLPAVVPPHEVRRG